MGGPLCRERAGGPRRRGRAGAGGAGAGGAGAHLGVVLGPHLRQVHIEDLDAALDVGRVDADLPVESARPQQRRVESVGPVGAGEHDNLAGGREAVHLDQQLVERVLALVVAAKVAAAAARLSDGVDLVNEDDARLHCLGLPLAKPRGDYVGEARAARARIASAWAKRSRTRAGPTPTNISMKSEPRVSRGVREA